MSVPLPTMRALNVAAGDGVSTYTVESPEFSTLLRKAENTVTVGRRWRCASVISSESSIFSLFLLLQS